MYFKHIILEWRWYELRNLNEDMIVSVLIAIKQFEPIASALVLQYSAYWAMKNNALRAVLFVEFILTCERNEAQNEDVVNCGITNLNKD